MSTISRSASRIFVRRAFIMALLTALCIAHAPARAGDDTPSPTIAASTSESIDRAIEHEKSRRRAAIAGMVVGGVAILGGSITSTVAAVENRNERHDGRPRTHNQYVPYLIGLSVGLPIEAISAYVFVNAQHKLNLLSEQHLSVSYSPETHRPILRLAFNF